MFRAGFTSVSPRLSPALDSASPKAGGVPVLENAVGAWVRPEDCFELRGSSRRWNALPSRWVLGRHRWRGARHRWRDDLPRWDGNTTHWDDVGAFSGVHLARLMAEILPFGPSRLASALHPDSCHDAASATSASTSSPWPVPGANVRAWAFPGPNHAGLDGRGGRADLR